MRVVLTLDFMDMNEDVLIKAGTVGTLWGITPSTRSVSVGWDDGHDSEIPYKHLRKYRPRNVRTPQKNRYEIALAAA